MSPQSTPKPLSHVVAVMAFAALLLMLPPGCVTEPKEASCEGAKCDNVGGSSFEKALEGRADPVAEFLRKEADENGLIYGNYRTVLDGVGAELGCDRSTERTYTILLTRTYHFPRHMITRCADDPTQASQFFLSTQSDDALDDIDPTNVRMYAWDATARHYRWYNMKPEEPGGPMKVHLDPPECVVCHAGPLELDSSRMPWIPLMNEIVNPWTLWNAEPDFRSHQFDDTIDPALLEAPIYKEMTEGQIDSAANFERHIRAAFDRVTTSRLRARRNDANITESLDLLRPLFCDETLNYVSENHLTGETRADIIIDDSVRRLFLTIRPDNWPWAWLNDGVLRLPAPGTDESHIAVMPVRGEANIQVEVGLVSRGVLTAQQALRLRALDWKKPALSDFRCGLFTASEERLRLQPPDLTNLAKNSDLIPVLFEEIMSIQTLDGTRVSLASSDPDKLIVMEDIREISASEALTYGDFAAFEQTTDEFGEALQVYFAGVQEVDADFRTNLEPERMRRGCVAVASYPASPLVPGTDTCNP